MNAKRFPFIVFVKSGDIINNSFTVLYTIEYHLKIWQKYNPGVMVVLVSVCGADYSEGFAEYQIYINLRFVFGTFRCAFFSARASGA